MEYQIRNWLYFTWLSGDHINEQAIHSLDKTGWLQGDVHPVQRLRHRRPPTTHWPRVRQHLRSSHGVL